MTADGDTGPAIVTDHAYVQRDPWAWWSVCKVCGLAEPAHKETTRRPATEDHGVKA